MKYKDLEASLKFLKSSLCICMTFNSTPKVFSIDDSNLIKVGGTVNLKMSSFFHHTMRSVNILY